MSYDYETQKPNVFKEDRQKMFLRIRDNAKQLTDVAGAATAEKLMRGCSGDTWDMLACIDRLVEIGELHEIVNPVSRAGQHRLFIPTEWEDAH